MREIQKKLDMILDAIPAEILENYGIDVDYVYGFKDEEKLPYTLGIQVPTDAYGDPMPGIFGE